MIITDYYKFTKSVQSKCQSRFDCIVSTKNHPFFESLRNRHGWLYIYFGKIFFRIYSKRRSDTAITTRYGNNLTSVFTIDASNRLYFGDIPNSTDALIIRPYPNIDNPIEVEIYICRGQKDNKTAICSLLLDGELNNEMEYFTKQASKEDSYNKDV